MLAFKIKLSHFIFVLVSGKPSHFMRRKLFENIANVSGKNNEPEGKNLKILLHLFSF